LKNTIRVLFLSIFFLQVIQSCKKDKEPNPVPTDYRSDFTGEFQFTVCNTHWQQGIDTFYVKMDTVLINGIISLYLYNQLLIKYDTCDFTGIWLTDTADCSGYMLWNISDSLLNNWPDYANGFFAFYYEGWVSPVFHKDAVMDIPCIPFRLSGGVELAFGGYFINTNLIYLFYSGGGLGSGSYKYVYGRRL